MTTDTLTEKRENRLAKLYESTDSIESYATGFIGLMTDMVQDLDIAAVAKAAEAIEKTAAADKTFFVVGNGGSGAVAAHWVNDLSANTVVDGQPGYRVISLTDNAFSVTALGNDASYDEIFEIQLKANMRPGDVVLAMSVSGGSPNIIRAVEYANANGAYSIGCTGFNGGKLKEISQLSIHMPSSKDEYGPVEDMFSVIMHIIPVVYLDEARPLPGPLNPDDIPEEALSKTLKVGLIGLGRMGGIRYRELQNHPHAEVVCGADPNESLFAAYPGVRCSTDPEDVLQADIDAVVICTPNKFTPLMVCQALDGGKHVLCEKPPGRTLKDVHDIIEAEKRNPNLALKFGFNHRYHAGIQEARRIIDSGRLGHLLWMRGVYGKAGGDGFEDTWRSDRELAGGGILLDQGIHMLDLLRYFCGDFTEVKSMVSTSYWKVPLEDNAFALLRDEYGRTAMVHSSSTHWKHRFTLELFMSDGYLTVNGILSSTRSYGDETISVARNRFNDGVAVGKPTEEIIYFDTDPSWQLEVEDFVDSAINGTPVESGTSEDALKVMELIYAIYENDESFMKTGNPFYKNLPPEPKE